MPLSWNHGSGSGGGHMNFRSLFQDFNASKFVVFSCLLNFSILFALKADGGLQSFSWWSVFIPLWIWKGMAILGACVGSYVWWLRPQGRLNAEEYLQYKAMLISLATHLLLLMFELLAADNLTSRRHLWILVFVPLVFVSLVSIPISIWSLRNDRSFELELFCAVNILQFIFLALKLDRLILWPWEFIFIPLWIVLCISLAGVLYTIIFAGILLRMPEFNNEQRRTSTNLALCYSFMVIPMIVFLVLLTNKLDGTIRVSYFAAFSPLFLTFLTLLITSFGSKGGNQYWFGLRKPPCSFLFGICPCLQLFGNISYSLHNDNVNTQSSNSQEEDTSNSDISDDAVMPNCDMKRKTDAAVVPCHTLDMPD
ncbi:transmembrane protein 185A [Lepeophtheirus salmonis]|uniref:Uncharacterized protein n=1 Tax=Lepeophtheirus salmonis TaxID=72036 RepID=A0A0K2SX72_LEPSM|nr:transmembrane protein 185A-like [Lepeophtheirus salmonis]